jgi:hypothetical protein
LTVQGSNDGGGSFFVNYDNAPIVLTAQAAAYLTRQFPVDSTFVLVDNQSNEPSMGTLADPQGNTLNPGTSFVSGGVKLQLVSYTGDDGNKDVVLKHLNTPPMLTNLTFQPVEMVASALTGTIVDPDAGESFTVTVNWGDKHSDTIQVPAGQKTFSATHSYPEEGRRYQVQVTVNDGNENGITTATLSPVVSDAPLQFTSVGNFSTGQGGNQSFPTEGNLFASTVATFTDPGSDGTAQDYSATIQWGDGQQSPGSVFVADEGGLVIEGSHVYQENGTYPIQVTLVDGGGSRAVGQGSEIVLDAPLKITIPHLQVVENETFNGVVANFTDPASDGTSGEYKATVNLVSFGVSRGGLHETIPGRVVPDGQGGFNVLIKTYIGLNAGAQLYITVMFAGSTAIGHGSTTVADAPLSASFNGATATVGQPFTAGIASFTDPGLGNGAGQSFTATIDWGDGTTSNGSLQSGGKGRFIVNGTHTYLQPQSYQVSVTIQDYGGSVVVARGTIQPTTGKGPTPFTLDNQGTLTILSNPLASGSSTITIGLTAAGGVTASVGKLSAVLAPGAVKQIIGMTRINAGKSTSDTWNVQATPAGVPLTIDLGPGHDVVNLAPKNESLSAIGGAVTINGGRSNGSLLVSDAADTFASRWAINAGAVSWQPFSLVFASLPPLDIQFNDLENVVIDGGSGTDSFDILGVPASATQMIINGDDNRAENVKADGGASGQVGAIIQVVGGVAVVVNGVLVNGVPNILGGVGANQFVFRSRTPFLGTIVGGSGSNTLDYSQYKGDVMVDLPLGIASLVTGSVSNITQVIGSQGNSLLVGDGNDNFLQGGLGRNILIGGAGSDTLDATASKDDNILIGGATQWDMNLTALQAIAQVWNDTTQSFDQRVQALQNGVVIGGQTYALDRSTVQPDNSPDSLNGGGGRNWFFVDFDDTINGGKGAGSSDLVTNVGQVT